ncbi:MAG TPA: glycosyl hydrolase family 8 [Mycobacteriales bacterium]|jgi:endoglucanase|nr:glycosyl hydrolase family 8 [Mycobacteriales bacterium]
MLRRRSDLVAVTAALALVCAGLLGGCTGTARGETSGSSATASARQFLHRYVSSSGAVVRHDQGGDTVSEGQGYAMLLAYAVNDRSLFTKIWRWTSRHLRQPSGLFAYHWQNGSVADTQPAADADTQIAWALDLAGRRWSITADTTAARRIAGAIAANEIGYDENGRPTLAAGPWAVGAGQPVQVEPGYWTFPADAALAVLTNDNRWRDLAAADAAHLKALTRNGATLPPDWATIGSGSGPTPSPAPGTGASIATGQDGLRALAWAACLPATHTLDARWWKLVAPTARSGPLTRNIDGSPAADGPSPLSLVAAAAAAKEAGHVATMRSLLARANQTAQQQPTYYGDAWNAIGHILLSTKLIPGCTP